MPLKPYTANFTFKELSFLLKRLLIGVRYSDIEHFSGRSVTDSVDALLEISPFNPPVKDYDTTGLPEPDSNIKTGETWVNDFNKNSDIVGRRISSFKRWWIASILKQPPNISEKLALFWANHFSTDTQFQLTHYMYDFQRYFRTNGLGNFKTMVKDVTTHPEMLLYLNGALNTKYNPDENYARELQELFTIGNNNSPNFTEDDVKAAARVLTGWSVNWDKISPAIFWSGNHDTEDKSFSSFYNHFVIKGRVGVDGASQELDDLLTMIFSKQEEVGVYIVTRLYRYFCSAEITPSIVREIIQPLANTFYSNNWQVLPVLRELFTSEHFYTLPGTQIKAPMDFIAGIIKEFSITTPATNPSTAKLWDTLVWKCNELGLNMGDPPNVAGWPAYYQSPIYDKLWINSATLPARTDYINALSYGWKIDDIILKIDPISFAKKLNNPADPNFLLQESIDFLFQVPVSASKQQTIKKEILLNNLDNDNYWSFSWNAYMAKPSDTALFEIVNRRLTTLYQYLLNMPEYQLM